MTLVAYRPDPRNFPSETAWLLVLLGAIVLANGWSVAGWLADPAGQGEGATWIQLVGLLAPGPVTYLLYARWRVRRARLPQDPGQAEAGRAVEDLAGAVGGTSGLQVRTDPGLGARAYVAGRSDQPYLVLGPELLALYGRGADQRAVFEAVVRHELAHLRSGDLRWGQLAAALRVTNAYSLVWLVFGIALALSVGEVSAWQLSLTALRAVGVVVLAEAVARAFLRVREHQAELYAAADGVDGLLQALKKGRDRSAARSWLRRHPGARQPASVLTEPGLLLASPPGQVLLAAATAGVLLVTIQDLVQASEPSDPRQLTIMLGLLVGVPLTLFVALTLWRLVWHTTASGSASVLACGVTLAAGLVLGSHLSPYARTSGLEATGIPLDPPMLVATTVGAVGLCWWLAVLAWVRAGTDPHAVRLGPFLAVAGLGAAVVGGWLFAVLWTWAARLLGLRLGCTAEQYRSTPLCRSPDAAADVARSVAAEFAFTPYSLVTVVLLAVPALVVVPGARRPGVAAGTVAVAVLAVVGGLWWAGQLPPAAPVRLELRPVLDAAPAASESLAESPYTSAERQTADADALRRVFTDFACPQADPLIGTADPVLPLITCSADGAEKFRLGPVELDNDDVERAEAGLSDGSAEYQITVTFTDAARWEELTASHTGQRLAILVDDVVVTAPQILEPQRGGTTVISGGFTADQARTLANHLTDG